MTTRAPAVLKSQDLQLKSEFGIWERHKLTTQSCKDPRGGATYVTSKEWGIGSQMMIEAHSSHLIFGLSVVRVDIATSKAAGTFYRFLPSLVPTLQKVFVRQRPPLPRFSLTKYYANQCRLLKPLCAN